MYRGCCNVGALERDTLHPPGLREAFRARELTCSSGTCHAKIIWRLRITGASRWAVFRQCYIIKIPSSPSHNWLTDLVSQDELHCCKHPTCIWAVRQALLRNDFRRRELGWNKGRGATLLTPGVETSRLGSRRFLCWCCYESLHQCMGDECERGMSPLQEDLTRNYNFHIYLRPVDLLCFFGVWRFSAGRCNVLTFSKSMSRTYLLSLPFLTPWPPHG